jgi:hypothetical protein
MPDAPAKPVLFLAYANDRIDPARYLPQIVEEVHFIRDLLTDKASAGYEIVVRDQASIDDLFAVFDRYGPQIHLFHFAGHADSLRLLLDQGTDARAQAGIAGFTRELATLSGLHFVFLNACLTHDQAMAMAEAGVPAVVATSTAISDRAAYLFAQRFYEQLAQRRSLMECFQAAERRVQAELMQQADDYRVLYWNETPRQHFPWSIHGEGVQWRLMLPQRMARRDQTPLMVDRDRQVISFRDKAEEILADANHLPHTFIIHGTREERHDSLVTRLVETDIRVLSNQLFGETRGVVHEREVRNWPHEVPLAQRKRELKRRLAEAMAFSGQGTTDSWQAQDLVERLGLRARTVVLTHTISSERWDADTQRLIRWYIDECWQLPARNELPQFVLFIAILYPEEEVSWWQRLFGGASPRQQIKESLDVLAADLGERLTVLSELKPISYGDVVSWVDEYYPRELADFPEVLYGGKPDRSLSMAVVEPALQRAVRGLNAGEGSEVPSIGA